MSYEPTDAELKQLLDRYLAQWNEPDPDLRGSLIRQVWAVDGVQVLVNPPDAIRDCATHYGIASPPLVVRGHDAFDARVHRAHELFVAPGQYVFDVLTLDTDARIRTDHQFVA